MDLRDTYELIAEDWHKSNHDDTWWVEGTDRFISELPSDASVLDVGCGGGTKSRYLASKGLAVTGIDFSEKMVEIARRESPDIHFEVADLYQIDAYPEMFDGIFAQAVLLHVPKSDIKSILTKLRGRLKPGGLLYIAVKGIKDDGKEEVVKKENEYGYEYERFFSYFTLVELENYLNELSMEIVWKSSSVAGRATWLQIIGRRKSTEGR